MSKKRLILAIVGQASGGKDTAAEYLAKKYKFNHVSTSDLLRKYADEHNHDTPNREALQLLANNLRQEYGANFLVSQALASIPKENIVISGLRNPEEALLIHDLGGIIIVVNATIEIRYARAELRNRPGDSLSFSAFSALEDSELYNKYPNSQNLSVIFGMADEFIENNTSLEDLEAKLNKLIKLLLRQNK